MNSKDLDKLWSLQISSDTVFKPEEILVKAKKIRKLQLIGIAVMTTTVCILIAYAFFMQLKEWNTFTLGVILMIFSLSFRVVIEIFSVFSKEKQLITMAANSYRAYLKKYYKSRVIINFIITPICLIAYIYGFYLLLPYFKDYFSSGFYTYLLVSGIVSLLVISVVIIRSIIREQRFLKSLR